MIKLKKLIKEGSPGFTKREFGDPLPTFNDVMGTHQQIQEADEKIRPATGSAPSKKDKEEMNDALYKVMKKFRRLGGGYVEVATEKVARGYYNIKYQIARRQKSGKHRDWLFFHIDKRGNVEITPKQRKMFKAGNLKNPNKVAKILNQWSDENLDFS